MSLIRNKSDEAQNFLRLLRALVPRSPLPLPPGEVAPPKAVTERADLFRYFDIVSDSPSQSSPYGRIQLSQRERWPLRYRRGRTCLRLGIFCLKKCIYLFDWYSLYFLVRILNIQCFPSRVWIPFHIIETNCVLID